MPDSLNWQSSNYVAFVIDAAKPHHLRMIKLGDVRPIMESLLAWRNSQLDPTQGHKLRQLVFEPLSAAIGPARTIFLCLDGDLLLLPFAALPDETGTTLAAKYTF